MCKVSDIVYESVSFWVSRIRIGIMIGIAIMIRIMIKNYIIIFSTESKQELWIYYKGLGNCHCIKVVKKCGNYLLLQKMSLSKEKAYSCNLYEPLKAWNHFHRYVFSRSGQISISKYYGSVTPVTANWFIAGNFSITGNMADRFSQGAPAGCPIW